MNRVIQSFRRFLRIINTSHDQAVQSEHDLTDCAAIDVHNKLRAPAGEEKGNR
jgi:hypothetical protein